MTQSDDPQARGPQYIVRTLNNLPADLERRRDFWRFFIQFQRNLLENREITNRNVLDLDHASTG